MCCINIYIQIHVCVVSLSRSWWERERERETKMKVAWWGKCRSPFNIHHSKILTYMYPPKQFVFPSNCACNATLHKYYFSQINSLAFLHFNTNMLYTCPISFHISNIYMTTTCTLSLLKKQGYIEGLCMHTYIYIWTWIWILFG